LLKLQGRGNGTGGPPFFRKMIKLNRKMTFFGECKTSIIAKLPLISVSRRIETLETTEEVNCSEEAGFCRAAFLAYGISYTELQSLKIFRMNK
jgi:hypothetical protein